jgi:uncharacterized OB-fold protein
MKKYDKPLPQPTAWSKPFWEGCKRHELLIQKCKDCRSLIFYPKLFCPKCLSTKFEWIKASGKGKVYTYTVVQSYPPSEFAGEVPYAVGVVILEEGVRLMSNIVGCSPEAVKCDMPVEVVFDDVTEEITLPKFKPIGR